MIDHRLSNQLTDLSLTEQIYFLRDDEIRFHNFFSHRVYICIVDR